MRTHSLLGATGGFVVLSVIAITIGIVVYIYKFSTLAAAPVELV